jgi:hypothetical protein
MSRDTYPRHRYAVTFAVTLFLDAETEDKAADYAEERLEDALDTGAIGSNWRWRVEDVTREDGA